jgi:hypothetical protein
MSHMDVLKAAGLTEAELSGGTMRVRSPIDGAEVAKVRETAASEMPAVIARSQVAPGRAGAASGRGTPCVEGRAWRGRDT